MKYLNTLMLKPAEVTPVNLLPLTEKVILGSAVCIIEGAAAHIAFSLPKGLLMYLGCFVMLLTIWVAMGRFRTCKLGIDINELYFYEMLIWFFSTVWFMLGKSTVIFQYFIVGLLFLRLIRVYARPGTTTHDHGWGVFGFVSYFNDKDIPLKKRITSSKQGYIALFMAICLAAIATGITFTLSDKERQALTWGIALFYIIANGPTLLAALTHFMTKHIAMEKREAAVQAAKADMQETIIAFQKKHDLPNEKAAKLLALFLSIDERKQNNLIELAEILVSSYPTTSPPPKD